MLLMPFRILKLFSGKHLIEKPRTDEYQTITNKKYLPINNCSIEYSLNSMATASLQMIVKKSMLLKIKCNARTWIGFEPNRYPTENEKRERESVWQKRFTIFANILFKSMLRLYGLQCDICHGSVNTVLSIFIVYSIRVVS